MSKRRIVFVVTQNCQLRCNYCYLVEKNDKGVMTWETAKQIVDLIMSLPVVEDEVIFDFIGGEPLLEIELISNICDFLVNRMRETNHPWLHDFSFRITTNGLSYSTQSVQRFINKYKDRLSIQLSIDGTKRKHDLNRVFANGCGSYDKMLPNVQLWINQFQEKAMSFTVVSHNDLPFFSESIIHNIELGIKTLSVTLVVEDVWESGDEIIFERELIKVADYIIDKKLWTTVSISSFDKELGLKEEEEHIYPCGNPMYVFDAHGDIYTCVRFINYSLREKEARKIGSLQKGIDYNKLRPFLAFDRISSYSDKCQKCEIGIGCRWCPAENYDSSKTGTIFQRTVTICQLHKANVRVKNYFWNKINYLESNGRQKT